MSLMSNIVSTVASVAIFFLFRDRVVRFLQQKNMVVLNYKGYKVLTGGGLLLLFPTLFAAIPAILMVGLPEKTFYYGIYMIMLLALALCGFLDDTLGDSHAKGLVGHIRFFIKGRLTTGFIKALTGAIIGLILALYRYERVLTFLLDILAFSLCVNMINLLDLRPGRAMKGFLFILFPVLVSSSFSEMWMLLPVISVLLCYADGELKEIYMLGDTGANLLGGILGFYVVIALSITGKAVLTLLLGTLHLISEFQSLSKWIEAVPLLKKIDMLGRKN